MEEKDLQHVNAILEAINKILKVAENLSGLEEFKKDRFCYEAIIMNLVVIDEMDSKVSPAVKELYQDVQWQKIKMYKNMVYNTFYDVDAEGVWFLVKEKLPKLKSQLLEALNKK
jgi:uncharacterized protein with HEPN domain